MIHFNELSLRSLFIAAPITVLPLLDKNSRLDLIDLFDANQTAIITNKFDGKTQLTDLSDSLVSLRLTGSSSMTMSLTDDTIIVVRHTVHTPDFDDIMESHYTTDWKLINKNRIQQCQNGSNVK